MKVLVVDDHLMIRTGIRVLLHNTDFEVIGEASNGYQAVELVSRLHPDLVLMDLTMPGLGGLAATRQIRRHHPGVTVVVLTASTREEDLLRALQAGANGYLLKSIGAEELIRSLHRAAQGETPIASSLATLVVEKIRRSDSYPIRPVDSETDPRLSVREEEVLMMIGLGLTYKEVAVALHVAENTVKSHMRRILTKLGLRNRSEAVRYTLQNPGLIRLEVPLRQSYGSELSERIGGE